MRPAHNDKVCSTWGNFHFKTFDGDFFQLPSTCNYELMSLCEDRNELNIQLRRALQNGQPTIAALSITLQGDIIKASNDSVIVNKKEWVAFMALLNHHLIVGLGGPIHDVMWCDVDLYSLCTVGYINHICVCVLTEQNITQFLKCYLL